MTKYRYDLPQLSDRIFLTDGGLETTLIFHDGMDLPYFASFDLMNSEAGRRRLHDYFVECRHDGAQRRPRIRSGERDVASQSRLGRPHGADGHRARGDQPPLHRDAVRSSREPGDEPFAHGDLRQYRAARRRLQPRPEHDRRRGRSLPRMAGQHFPQHRRRHGERLHDDHGRGGGRHRARRQGRRYAGRHLLHSGDRRTAANRSDFSRKRSRPSTPQRTHSRLIS